MAEPHDSLLAFLADLSDQVEAFEQTAASHSLTKEVLKDIGTRLVAAGVVVKMQEKKGDADA